MNDTPTTNARWETLCCSGQSWYQIAEEMKLDCRQLERELAEVTEQRDRLIEQQEQWRLSSVCRELTEQRDRLIETIEPLKYWRDISECDCSNPLPQGGCLRCDLERILKLTNPNEL